MRRNKRLHVWASFELIKALFNFAFSESTNNVTFRKETVLPSGTPVNNPGTVNDVPGSKLVLVTTATTYLHTIRVRVFALHLVRKPTAPISALIVVISGINASALLDSFLLKIKGTVEGMTLLSRRS